MNKKIFDRFKIYLTDRLLSEQHLTEDSVRYSYFSALIDENYCKQHEVILESPHPSIPKGKIDTFLNLSTSKIFIEFKYHRETVGTSGKPQKAGILFKDFNRMSLLCNDADKYVIYFTDDEMARYFNKQGKKYNNFWSLDTGTPFLFDSNFLKKTTKTFKEACGCIVNCNIEMVYSSSLDMGHEIRIFKVKAI